MTSSPSITLNNGVSIPQVGLGVFQVPSADAQRVVETAIEAGYRHIDTAAAYNNEAGVGAAIRSCGLPREELFVTTKLRNGNQGYDEALLAYDESCERLGLEQVDLYLVHWPFPSADRYVDSWRALERLYAEQRVRAVGVSNFLPEHLKRLFAETELVPAVNQIELHPHFQQVELRAFHDENYIVTTSWSPLGRGGALSDPLIVEIARKHQKTPAQIIIRWHIDNGLAVIPKSSSRARQAENLDVFDFSLDAEDIHAIAGIDRADGRIGPDPDLL